MTRCDRFPPFITLPPGRQGPVSAPFGEVPGGSTLSYSVKLLRLSRTGPDELYKGISFCGKGGAGAQAAGCGLIEPAE